MTESQLDIQAPVLKGVVTEITDDGNYGKINCGGGRVFTFDADQLAASYVPVLKDVVQFSLIDDAPFNIHLYHRDRALQSAPRTGVDLRVRCPKCGASVLPKAEIVDGKLVATRCPQCLEQLEKIEQPPKTSFWIWILAILCGITVAVATYTLLEP